MAWARLDDQFWSNPKIIAAGNDAAGAYARLLCYCSANSTDGFIPKPIASQISARSRTIERLLSSQLIAKAEPGDVFVVSGRKDSGRRKLPDVEVVVESHGYYIRDYLHYNRARSDLRADESADERANVQIKRANVHSPTPPDARAARPDPSLSKPFLPSSSREDGKEGIENGNGQTLPAVVTKEIPA